MPVFACRECGKRIKAPDSAAGKKAKCPGCGKPLTIPNAKRSANKGTQKDEARPRRESSKTQSPSQPKAGAPPAFSDHGNSDDPFADLPAFPAASQGTTHFKNPIGEQAAASEPTTTARDFSQSAASNSAPPFQAGTSTRATSAGDSTPAYLRTATSSISESAIRQAFVGSDGQPIRIPARKPSAWYAIGMALALVFTLILPGVYLSILAGISYLAYLYVVNVFGAIFSGNSAGILIIPIGILASAPLILLLTLILFLVKPFLIPRRDQVASRQLVPETEPALFALIDEVCKACNAPIPKKVQLCCDVNAAASLEGLFSKDLTLIIGAPLLSGLTLSQFAGVLAHEFGHFTQGFGMKASYAIRTVNHWIWRVISEPDVFDDFLVQMIDDGEGPLALFWYVVSRFILCTYILLALLATVADVACCLLLRQMEYDADYYEVQLSGSKSFEETCHEMRALNLAYEDMIQQLGEFLNRAQLADNLPMLISHKRKSIKPDRLAYALKKSNQEGWSPISTHPTDRARIAHSNLLDADGQFGMQQPASMLLRNYRALCNQVSRDFYEMALGRPFKPEELKPTEQLLAR